MIAQAPERRPPVAVIFDSSLDSIDHVLTLAMLLAANSNRDIRLSSVSTSRHNLRAAAFCDLVCRFYNVNNLPIGMFDGGTAEASLPAMMEAPLSRTNADGRPLYNRRVEKFNDTADAVALIRNALTAQQDQNAVIVLAGSPANLLRLIALPGTADLIKRKARSLVAASTNVSDKLLAAWPGPVVMSGADIGEALRFPGQSIEQDFPWATNHPVLDAYRAAGTMPYDAPAPAMAAALYAMNPNEQHFTLAEAGKHRRLQEDPAHRENVLKTYRQLVSTKPPEPGRGARGFQP